MKPYHLTPGASQGNSFTAHLRASESAMTKKPANKTNAQHGQDMKNLALKRPMKPGPAFNFAAGRTSE